MKVNELVNIINQNRTKPTKAEHVQALLKKELDIKEYLSIKDKKALVQNIANECLFYEDGIYKFNDIDKYVCFTMKTIAAYTGLELSDDIEDDYDLLCHSKLLDAIIDLFKKEYDDVNILLQMRCDYILSSNTLESQVGRFFDDLSEKIDALATVMGNKVNNFSIKDLPISNDDITKIIKLVGAQK